MITRAREQAGALYEQLCAHGARVVEAPTIEIHPPQDLQALDRVVADVSEYDWLILTSANGVDALVASMDRLAVDARHLAGVKIAVVGHATEAALHDHLRLTADLIPEDFMAEALADELIKKWGIEGKRLLLMRGDIAQASLPRQLAAAGASITEVTAYQTKAAEQLPGATLELLREGSVEWITFTSASTARSMSALLGDERGLIEGVKIASIGPVTSRAVVELGWQVAAQGGEASVDGLVDAILRG
jgi:uroporphyrinogen III methyltransferase/synthase